MTNTDTRTDRPRTEPELLSAVVTRVLRACAECRGLLEGRPRRQPGQVRAARRVAVELRGGERGE